MSKLRTQLPTTDPSISPALPHPFFSVQLSKLGCIVCAALLLCYSYLLSHTRPVPFAATVERSPTPATNLAGYCSAITPIHRIEFLERQTRLAQTLHSLNASAYIAEPGANALYYGNISVNHWHLSERPLLLVFTPQLSSDDKVEAKTTIVTPKFEATRAKGLTIPAVVQYVEWAEEANPYEIAASVLPDAGGVIYVDSSIRHFLVDGLQKALPNSRVVSAPQAITQLRERKSASELEVMKCVNEVTLLAIRETHARMYLGIRESEARNMMASALAQAGLQGGSCLTQFGENAALPHGSGTDRVLGQSDFALFDCTASLHGYWSDVTRTVALPGSRIPEEHRHIWHYVHSAQTIASHTARAGTLTRKVDEAARNFLKFAEYDVYFAHRLGHGIGLEVHEQPYLRGGSDDVIQIGHTFSDEPGVYIEGKVGVRLEDCFYINEEGTATLLTQGVGGQSVSPWLP